MSTPADKVTWGNWRFGKAIRRLPARVVRDVKETVMDAKDEPGEVLYRIRERARSYLPGGVEEMPADIEKRLKGKWLSK